MRDKREDARNKKLETKYKGHDTRKKKLEMRDETLDER